MIDDPGLALRSERSQRIGRHLTALDETAICELITNGEVLGEGIGGTRSLITVGGHPVFVKRVPLTDLERLPENVGSTTNLFELPMGCQYGVGSPSFGVWREVAANTMVTSLATSGSCGSFPLLHHWRALPLPAFDGPLPDELGDIDGLVAHWHGSPAVRRRVEAIATSTATVALFFEYIPRLLPDALAESRHSGALTCRSVESTCAQLIETIDVMNSAGIWHFDTHFGNILTDEAGISLTDFGLATSTAFDLTPAEIDFLRSNETHDVANITTRLVNWIVTDLGGIADWEERNDAIRGIAAGRPATSVVPGAGSSTVERFAPVAAIINRFYERLHGEDRRASYPTGDVEAAWQSANDPRPG